MSLITVKLVGRSIPKEKILKQIKFGTAAGLTKTAKEGQAASVDSIKANFTVRGTWWQQGNKFGIKITPAKRDNLVAEVKTLADWLEPHERGGLKRSRTGGQIAIPTANVRRNKREIIPKAQRPNALRAKGSFVLQTAKGPMIFMRKFKGKRAKIVALYGLEKDVKIQKRSTFYEPIEEVVKQRVSANVQDAIENAFATMK